MGENAFQQVSDMLMAGELEGLPMSGASNQTELPDVQHSLFLSIR